MATSTGLGFDLDDVIKNAKEADKVLEKMVDRSAELSKNMTQAFKAGATNDVSRLTADLQKIQSMLSFIGNNQISLNVNDDKLKQAEDALNHIINLANYISKGRISLFNGASDIKELNEINAAIRKNNEELDKQRNRLQGGSSSNSVLAALRQQYIEEAKMADEKAQRDMRNLREYEAEVRRFNANQDRERNRIIAGGSSNSFLAAMRQQYEEEERLSNEKAKRDRKNSEEAIKLKRRENEEYLKTAKGALEFASKTYDGSTIHRQETALRNLKEVYNTLSPSTKDYANVQIQLKNEIDRISESLKREKQALSELTIEQRKNNAEQINSQKVLKETWAEQQNKRHSDYVGPVGVDEGAYKDEMEEMSRYYSEQERLSKEAHDKEVARTKHRWDVQRQWDERRRQREEQETRRNAQRVETQRGTYQGALYYSRQAKSINELQKAIQYLDKARRKERQDTEASKRKFQELTIEMQRQQKAYNNLVGSAQRSGSRLLNIGQQVARATALMFSVSAIRGYIDQLVRVRGEFELQQRSLQVLLQNKDEADQLWSKTVQLAVRSPFTVQQLVTYTKQLAAYRIESEKLYETNKMLADISAGLGVDMNRLILAYGQVKAANYLRGTELRQFSEAGVNILSELADYFGEIEGRTISVGEVFERVSKRMVSFYDVDAVLKKLTSEGGTFFRMQEIQAETLKGQISNLRDSIDIMLNDIGKSNDGMLKSGVSIARTLVDNWEVVADAVSTVVVGLAAYKASLLFSGNSLLSFATKHGLAINYTNGLAASLSLAGQAATKFGKKLLTSVVGNPWITAITVMLVAGTKLYNFYKKQEQEIKSINDKFYEQIATIRKLGYAYEELISQEKKLTKEQRENEEETNAIYEKKKDKLKELVKYAKSQNITLSIDIKEPTKETIDNVVENIQSEIYASLERSKALQESMTTSSELFGRNFSVNAKRADEYARKLIGANIQLDKVVSEIAAKEKDIHISRIGSYKELLKGREEGETELQYLNRRLGLIRRITSIAKVEQNFVTTPTLESRPILHKVIEDLKFFNNEIKELYREVSNIKDEVLKQTGETSWSVLPESQKITLLAEFDKELAKYSTNELVQSIMHDFVNKDWELNVEINTDGVEKELADWQIKYNEFLDSIESIGEQKIARVDSTNLNKTRKQLAQEMQGSIDIWQDIVDQINSGALSYGDKTTEELNKAQNNIKELNKAITYLVGSKRKGKKDPELELLKDRFSEIKKVIQEYKKLREETDVKTTTDMLKRTFGEMFEKLGMSNILDTLDYNTEDIYVWAERAMELLKTITSGRLHDEIQKLQEVYNVEIGLEIAPIQREVLGREIEKYFRQYEQFKELEKLNITKEIGLSLGIESIDLSELTEKIESKKGELIGLKGEKQYQQYLERIKGYEKQNLKERINLFSEFIKKNTDEVKKAHDEMALNIGFAKQFFEAGAIDTKQYTDIIKEIVSDSNDKISKANLKTFKRTPEYIKAMGDLSAYSKNELEELIVVLEGVIAKSSSSMEADDIKAYGDAVENVKHRLKEIELPWKKNSISQINELRNLQKEYNLELANQAQIEAEINEYKDMQVRAEHELADLRSKVGTNTAPTTEELRTAEENVVTATKNLDAAKNKLAVSQSTLSTLSSAMGNITNGASNALYVIDTIIKGVHDSIKETINIFNEVKELADSFGVETDKGGWSQSSLFFDYLGASSDHAMSGWENLKSGNFIGVVKDVIGSIADIAKGINAMYDNKREQEIIKELELIDDLKKKYDELAEAIDGAYSIDTYKQAYAAARDNIQQQMDATNRALELEKDKKNADEERIQEFENDLYENEKALKELEEQAITDAGGFGSDSDVKNAAQSFIDAWFEAYQETGDGLSGLNGQFDEFFNNLIRKQAMMKVAEKYLGRYFDYFDQALEDYDLSADEAKELDRLKNEISPQLNEALKALMDSLGVDDIVQQNGSSLSELSKGIQGVTEQTANALEALLNSMRFYVASSNTELIKQTKCLNDIYALLNELTTYNTPNSITGRGVKVVM